MNEYFNNDKVQAAVLEWRELEDKESEYAKKLINYVFSQVDELVHAIINTHKFYRFEDTDELHSVAMSACYESIKRFDPEYITSKGEKVKIFSYLSLVAKNSMFYYTKRNQKNRNNISLTYTSTDGNDKVGDVESKEDLIYSGYNHYYIFIDTLKKNTAKKHHAVYDLMYEYFTLVGVWNKRDFYSFAKSMGMGMYIVRQAMKEMHKLKDVLYKEI